MKNESVVDYDVHVDVDVVDYDENEVKDEAADLGRKAWRNDYRCRDYRSVNNSLYSFYLVSIFLNLSTS